jgi:hypothetical protein
MPALQQPFNSAQYDPATGFSQLPVGKHPVNITASSIEANKDKTGGYVLLTVTAIDGPAKGMTMPYRLNLYNASQKAAEVAHRQMSALCHATGVAQFMQTEELHGKPFVVVVAPQTDDEKYHEIKSVEYIDGTPIRPGQYGPANGGGQQQQQAQPQGQQQQQPAQGAAWGGAPQGQQQQAQPQQQQGGNPAWGGGQQAQQQQQQAPANGGAAWGGQNPQGAGQKPAWG